MFASDFFQTNNQEYKWICCHYEESRLSWETANIKKKKKKEVKELNNLEDLVFMSPLDTHYPLVKITLAF